MTRHLQRFLPILFLILGISACATHSTYPEDPGKQVDIHIGLARDAISRGDTEATSQQVLEALTRPAGAEKVRALLAASPVGKAQVVAYMSARVSSVDHPAKAVAVINDLQALQNGDVLAPEQIRDIAGRLNEKVISGNATGVIPFTLTDSLSSFPALSTPANFRHVVDNTVLSLQSEDGGRRRDRLTALMEHVSRQGPASTEADRIQTLLPSLNLRSNELDVIAQLYPDFSARRRSALVVTVAFTLKGGDRLLLDDLTKAFQASIRGVEWVAPGGPHQIALVVERIRHDEKVAPERTQTVTYQQHEVDTMNAVLLMPRNASYLFDQVNGSTEIDYGYAIDAARSDGERYEEVVRGKVGGGYGRCQNQRIQNVFGGVSAAGFTANDDMRRRCSGASERNVDLLRQDVIRQVVDGVKRVPSIKRANELNR